MKNNNGNNNKSSKKNQSNNRFKGSNSYNHKSYNKNKMKGKQGRKDSSDPRINLDNARESKVEEDIAKGMIDRSANSINDFLRNPELLKSASNISFASITGFRPSIGCDPVPGILRYTWQPVYGVESEPYALNQAAIQIISYITRFNSRSKSYDAPDLITALLSAKDIYAAIACMQRAYSIINVYTEPNKYIPDAILQCMGFDAKDLRANLANMWFDLNNIIAQTNQIWIPNILPIVTRHIERNTYVYTDAAGPRAQIYVPVQSKFYKWSEVTISTGSALVPATISNNSSIEEEFSLDDPGSVKTYSWSAWVAMVRDMIQSLLNSSDRETMFADILKAYGEDKVFALPPFNPNNVLVPVYNAEILMQIENLEPVNRDYLPYAYVQNVTYNSVEPAYKFAENPPSLSPLDAKPAKHLLNFHIPNQPSNEFIVLATRLQTGGIIGDDKVTSITNIPPDFEDGDDAIVPKFYNSKSWRYTTTGSEAVTSVGIYRYNANGTGLFVPMYLRQAAYQTIPTNNFLIEHFDWHPFTILNGITSNIPFMTGGVGTITGFIGDSDNYTIYSDEVLDKLNEACMYSLFNVPYKL